MPLETKALLSSATKNYNKIVDTIFNDLQPLTDALPSKTLVPLPLISTFQRYSFVSSDYLTQNFDMDPAHYSIYYVLFRRSDENTPFSTYPYLVHNKFISKLASPKARRLLKEFVIIKAPLLSVEDLNREINIQTPSYLRSSRITRATYVRIFMASSGNNMLYSPQLKSVSHKLLKLPTIKSEMINFERQLPTTYRLQTMINMSVLSQKSDIMPFFYDMASSQLKSATPNLSQETYLNQLSAIGILAAIPNADLLF